MDANQPLHWPIAVYDDAPPPAEPKTVTLCPGARHLSRARYAIQPAQVTCRRCRELLDVLGLSPIR